MDNAERQETMEGWAEDPINMKKNECKQTVSGAVGEVGKAWARESSNSSQSPGWISVVAVWNRMT